MADKKNLYQRILSVSGAAVKKDTFVKINASGAGYKAVKYDDVLKEMVPLFEKEGLVFIASKTKSTTEIIDTIDFKGNTKKSYFVNMEVKGEVINVDNPTERHEVFADGHGMDNGDKAPGKAFSYASKNAMLKMFSILTGENDEERIGNLSDGKTFKPSTPGQPPKQNSPTPFTDVDQYTIPVGKYKGQRFDQIERSELISYCQFISTKPVDGLMKIFVDNARSFLKKNQAPIITTEDIPFN